MKARAGLALLLVAAAGFGWWRLRPVAGVSAPRPSILLVTVDTLRADRVGIGLTPGIDALAARGLVFEEALSSAPLTLPSHATILSGLEPPHHGVRDNGTYVFPADVPTVATSLKAQGYATGAFVAAYVLDRRFGLARGFDVYDDRVTRHEEGASVLESERRGDDVAAVAIPWIEAQAGPFFAWVHLYDPHAPYDAPADYAAAHPGKSYDAEVAYADAVVARVVEAARRRAGEQLVVLLLADHGESLGEHGETTHGFFVYQSTLRIPLVLVAPGVAPGRSPRRARTADVAATLLARAGAPALATDGADLLGAAPGRESYAETHYPQSLGWAPLHSYRVGDLKLIDAPRPELYDVRADPGERNDLLATREADARRLTDSLHRFRQGEKTAKTAADPEVAERLRALGYVGDAAPVADGGEAADPKDKVALWHRFEQATWAQARGDHRAAAAALQELVRDEPGNAAFRRALSSSLRRIGRAADAARVLADVPTTGPGDALSWHEQAVALAAADRVPEAIRAEQRASALNPLLPEVHNHLGVLLARRGDEAGALAEFERATELDPNNARAWNNRANALRSAGRRAEAADAYRAAARLDPRDADPRNGLAVLAVEAGDLAAAERLLREVLTLHPAHGEARLNLAVVLHRAGRVGEARQELRALLAARPDAGTAARATAFLRDIS